MKAWLNAHKALLGSVVAVVAAASGVLAPPYSEYLYAVAVALAALSGGPRPAKAA
jgi:hypothetical protein